MSKDSRKIPKLINLIISHKYNPFSTKLSPLDQEFNDLSFYS